MIRAARLTVTLPGWITLDSRDELIEKVRESAFPELKDDRTLIITWQAEDDWILRGYVEETIDEISSNFDWRDLHLEIDTIERFEDD